MKTLTRLTLALLFSVAIGPVFPQDFKAIQSRFFPLAHTGIDVEISRFGTYVALADWTDGNSVAVLDEHRDLLWRHKQPYYWAGTLKHAPILQFSPDESLLLYPGYRTDSDIGVVNPRSGEAYSVLTGHSGTVTALALSPDGSRLLSFSSGELFLWKRDGNSFRRIDRLPGHAPSITSISFSPDGSLVATGATDDRKREVIIYDVSHDHLRSAYRFSRAENNLSRGFTAIDFSPNGKWLAGGYSDSILLWRVPTTGAGGGVSGDKVTETDLQPVQRIEDIELGSVISLLFSPDSSFLFSGHYKDVRAYRLAGSSWESAATFSPHQGHINNMCFSSDGRWLAVAGDSQSNGLGLWSTTGLGPSPVGRILSILNGRVSNGQKRFLDDTLAARILATLPAEEVGPRDMFETQREYDARISRAAIAVKGQLQEETEKRFNVEREDVPGALYRVSIPLQTQGTYDIDHRTYTFRFMDEEATAKVDRDHARDLYRNWHVARVIATRVQTPDGPAYGDFRLRLPSGGATVDVGLGQNPFTGETLDRYGTQVPSVPVGPDLLIRNLSIEGIFPSLFRYYADGPLGHFDVQNTGSSTLGDLSVQFFIPGLSQAPTASRVSPSLGVGQRQSAEINATFAPTILSLPEGQTESAQLSIRYTSGGKTYTDTVVRSVSVLNRNAIRWTDDRKVAAFMFANDPALLRFSGRVVGMIDDPATNVMTRNLLTAIRMFEAVHAAGVSYVVDPTSPYASVSRDGAAIDYIRFPLETLDQRSGDCDDLSVLYNTLLESVGVRTAFITTPGHIFAAFDLGVPQKLALRLFPRSDDLIFLHGTTWMPIETTLPDEGFTRAWQTAGIEWREATAEQSANFFTTQSAWDVYAPAGYSAPEPVVTPPKAQVVALYKEQLDAYRKVTLGPKEAELVSQLNNNPSSEGENQLGILYAQYGLFNKSLEWFKRALTRGNYLPAMINAANVLSINKQYDEARAYLVQAEKLDPSNAHVLISLAFSYHETGSELEARNAFERARNVNPTLAARYPLFGNGLNKGGGDTLASSANVKAMEWFGSEWQSGE